eukprot:TRINITY_DN60839_c0_g1_i2.p1 TRINITY_DN60839_c0_g1~~TRINITY_DN60839_c0_g1_i2.p1  ORF type:complete len:556 (+),score=91.26 TRINITY_DN60839_c0_g1_i2:844-2511(+)
MRSSFSNPSCAFSIARPASGAPCTVAIGCESSVRPGTNGLLGTVRAAGETQGLGWSLTIDPTDQAGHADLALKTQDSDLDWQAGSLAKIFNMWSGSQLWNSPSSVMCLHEMSWHPMAMSVFGPTAPGTPSPNDAMRAELDRFANISLAPPGMLTPAVHLNGFVYARMDWGGFYLMAIHDQIPHFLLGYYYHAVNTGDAEFVRRSWPVLQSVAEYLLGDAGMNMREDGLANTPTSPGTPNANCTALPGPDGAYGPGQNRNSTITDSGIGCAGNWFDVINFGGKDAVVNALAIGALNGMAEMADLIGEEDAARTYRAQHAQSVAAFNKVFWNETEGLYGDWKDVDGRVRWYFYTWHNFMAVDPSYGIANQVQTKRIVESYDSNMARIREESNHTAEETWCTPTNLRGVAAEDAFVSVRGDQGQFGYYENGACFMPFVGLELMARGMAGNSSAALRRLKEVLDVYNATRFWGQHAEWQGQPGQPLRFDGDDVLTNTLILLWGAIRSVFGVHVSLKNGVTLLPSGPAAELEGAEYRFVVKGQPTTLRIVGGKTVVSTDA